MGFWAGYWKTLKPLEVEEPIDVWVHRPLAYLIARALFPTPVSPNMVTVGSILFGLAAGAALISDRPYAMQVAGVCLFWSAVIDCADGQLARMRGTSSVIGRMLDGLADLIVMIAAMGGGAYVLWRSHNDTWWEGLVWLCLAGLCMLTGSFHTSSYDHYKNVFLKLTTPGVSEAEDYATAQARYESRKQGDRGFAERVAWPAYFFYVRSQYKITTGFDPYTGSFGAIPEYSERNAAIYRKHAGTAMWWWRTFFGVGSLVFGVSLAYVLNLLEVYVVGRLVLQNGLFYLYLRPAQRRAGEAAMREMGALQDTSADG